MQGDFGKTCKITSKITKNLQFPLSHHIALWYKAQKLLDIWLLEVL